MICYTHRLMYSSTLVTELLFVVDVTNRLTLEEETAEYLSLNRRSMLSHFLLRLWGCCRSWGGESRATDRAVRREHCLLDTAGHCTVNSQQLGLQAQDLCKPKADQSSAWKGRRALSPSPRRGATGSC